MIFNVKMEDLREKARMVAGGHMTNTPPNIMYASVVSREEARIALTIAALHDLSVNSAEIMNTYIKEPCREKVYTILEPYFGPDEVNLAVIVRELYGLKSAGALFRNHLADCMKNMGYNSNKLKYYKYVLLCADDVHAIGDEPEDVLKWVDKYFRLKTGLLTDLNIYLGARFKLMALPNCIMAWSLIPSKYVQEAVKNVEAYVNDKLGELWKIPKMVVKPFPIGYEPTEDVKPELDPELDSYHQSIIGILRWMVKLGRIYIDT